MCINKIKILFMHEKQIKQYLHMQNKDIKNAYEL